MQLIGDEIFDRFKKLVACQFGLSIASHDCEPFRKTLSTLIKKCNSAGPEAYLRLLESDSAESKHEWKALALLATTGESYFFRDKGHFHLLQNIILPELINNKRATRSLRIWSAGCSTGEEPYSVAILLEILLHDLNGWKIEILGTDINEEFLKKGMRGAYSDWSFRMVDKDIQNKYFSKHKNSWEIHDRFKKMVTFQYGNLMEDGFFSRYPEISDMDIIICRNVFIYFKKEAVSSVFSNFMNILSNGGFLITGHGELHGHNLMNLRQIIYPEAVIYKKTSEFIEKTAEIGKSPQLANINMDYKTKVKPVTSKTPARKPSAKTQDPIPELEGLISTGRYVEALEKVNGLNFDKRDEYCILHRIAQACANAGEYENAEKCCIKAIIINADSVEPYFLLAQIAEAKGDFDEAKSLLNKAIYLNPLFIAAYCELGGIHERRNDHARARKFRDSAISLLMSLPSQETVKPYNLPAGVLLESMRDLIKQ